MSSYWCWGTVSRSHKNTWVCSLHFFVTAGECWHGGFISAYVMSCVSEDTQAFTAPCLECHRLRDSGHSTLWTAGSQETTAKREREYLKSKESANLFKGPSGTTGPLYYSSYWFQLITHSAGRTTLASHGSLTSLLSARTKLRTTGLLTGWGKAMRLLACHL